MPAGKVITLCSPTCRPLLQTLPACKSNMPRQRHRRPPPDDNKKLKAAGGTVETTVGAAWLKALFSKHGTKDFQTTRQPSRHVRRTIKIYNHPEDVRIWTIAACCWQTLSSVSIRSLYEGMAILLESLYQDGRASGRRQPNTVAAYHSPILDSWRLFTTPPPPPRIFSAPQPLLLENKPLISIYNTLSVANAEDWLVFPLLLQSSRQSLTSARPAKHLKT